MLQLSLDHLLIAVLDLDSASENYERLLGRTPSWRGSHPAYGTANVLFRIDNTYVELLAPGAAGRSPWADQLAAHLDTEGEGLYALALGASDIDTAVREIRDAGLHIDDPAEGSGVDELTGARREWVNARIPVKVTRFVPAFVIEHRSPPDALPMAPTASPAGTEVHALDHTVIAASDASAALDLWHKKLGLDLRLTLAVPEGRAMHFLRIGPPGADTSSVLEIVGPAAPNDQQQATSDALWGVAYRVKDIAATVERLRAAGVDVSDPRDGNAPGTVVADLKPGFSHDVRTIFIQKDVR